MKLSPFIREQIRDNEEQRWSQPIQPFTPIKQRLSFQLSLMAESIPRHKNKMNKRISIAATSKRSRAINVVAGKLESTTKKLQIKKEVAITESRNNHFVLPSETDD
jgi:hypothetical protein